MDAVQRWWPRLLLVTSGLTGATCLLVGEVAGWPLWAGLAAAGATLGCAVSPVLNRRSLTTAELTAARAALQAEQDQLREQQAALEELRVRSLALLQQQADRLREREHRLTERMAQAHELLEYPLPDAHAGRPPAELMQLSERDREVSRILEAEAERVYEKIRANGYMQHGRLNEAVIREELSQLVLRIAQVYAPHSSQPILETSFEQLARSASRICLHVLVLLEQLPLNVQQYDLNSLYGYLRKAIVGYGAYQKAAPWLTLLSRSLYAGKALSASNPVTLGAWWLASEAGRKGATKLVENLVDRQAVAVLHDLVTIIGVEVACIYGTGFRQRDPAWVLGTELVELIAQFPLSRDSLREGLRQITALPLRNEYDRIYLYRCLASQRSTRLRLADPAMLSREEREQIAARLEDFFEAWIHGATPSQVQKWRDGFEERFDLRLKLGARHIGSSQLEQVCSGIVSLTSFLTAAAGLPVDQAVRLVGSCRLPTLLTEEERQEFLQQLPAMMDNRRFEPPALDPASPLTDNYLQDLARCVVQLSTVQLLSPDDQLETLLVETGAYFRRTAGDMEKLSSDQWLAAVHALAIEPPLHPDLNAAAARWILVQRAEDEQITFCYPDVVLHLSAAERRPLQNAWLVGLQHSQTGQRRTLLLAGQSEHPLIWFCSGQLSVRRERGLLLDSALISGGAWLNQAVTGGSPQPVIELSGSLRGGRFRNYFGRLLLFAE